MSIALIQESAKEVRRLAIAGSPLAVGDFRLKKLIAPLEQAGAKVPVFAQVAKAIGDLVNGSDTESAAHLLNPSTRTTSRVLKPLVVALTSTGGGRFEVVRSAVERGAFNDLRLIEPSIRAL